MMIAKSGTSITSITVHPLRERSPYKDDIDIEDLDSGEMKRYAHICGKVLAQTHARSDEDTGVMEGSAEERILSSVPR